LRGAFNVLPVAELLVVDARTSNSLPQATEYQEYLAGRERQNTQWSPPSETEGARSGIEVLLRVVVGYDVCR
jgi:hypothetical protein